MTTQPPFRAPASITRTPSFEFRVVDADGKWIDTCTSREDAQKKAVAATGARAE